MKTHTFENSRIYCGDCMEGMTETPDGFYELAVCDPPFGIDDKLFRSSYGKNENMALAQYGKKRWDKKPDEKYWSELFRVSENQIVWGGNFFTKYLKPSRGWICWDKIRPRNLSFGDFELAWTSFDGNTKIFRYSAQGGFVAKPDDRYKIHPTQKPVALYDWIFKNYAKPGDKILDSHGGSFSSRIAAYKHGLDFTGYETDTEYFDSSVKRFMEALNSKQPVEQVNLFQGGLF